MNDNVECCLCCLCLGHQSTFSKQAWKRPPLASSYRNWSAPVSDNTGAITPPDALDHHVTWPGARAVRMTRGNNGQRSSHSFPLMTTLSGFCCQLCVQSMVKQLRCLRGQPTVVLPAKRQLCRPVKPWLNQQSDHHYVCYSHRTITMHVTATGPSLCMLQP